MEMCTERLVFDQKLHAICLSHRICIFINKNRHRHDRYGHRNVLPIRLAHSLWQRFTSWLLFVTCLLSSEVSVNEHVTRLVSRKSEKRVKGAKKEKISKNM